mgnify:CR=1 FL=1
MNQSPSHFKCFNTDNTSVLLNQLPSWYLSWQQKFDQSTIKMTQKQQQALASLIPLLLCGEQSAQLVFSNEITRLKNNTNDDYQQAIIALSKIEAEENAHELALQSVLERLPKAKDLSKIKRRAQVFYASLGQANTVAEHFILIRKLDSYVAIIMSYMARSQLGSEHLVSQLFSHIKSDEAGHVSIARKHIIKLGGELNQTTLLIDSLSTRLCSLLSPQKAAFKDLGVDIERLLEQIEKSN